MPGLMDYVNCCATACLGAALMGQQSASGETAMDVDVSLDARASLFYYLECVNGGISCSRAEIGDLLAGILGSDEAERVAAQWASSINKYAVQVRLNEPSSTEWPDIGPDSSANVDLRWRLQEILFSGEPSELVRTKLGVIMSEADVRSLDASLDAAWPRYSEWWSRHEGEWTVYAAGLETIFRPNAMPAIQAARRMFDHAHSDPLIVHLVPLPVEVPVQRAFQKGTRSFVEFRPDNDPAARVAVIVHEYCHYLFRTAPQRMHEMKLAAFAGSAEPSSASAFSVMNEALASAIGNGLFMKSYLEPARFDAYASRVESFYALPAVDRAAKAALLLIERYARAERSFDREFFAEYFHITAAEFEDDPADPRIALGVSQVYYTSDALEKVAIETGKRYPFSSVYYNAWKPGEMAETMGMRFGSLPVALFASPEDYASALEILAPGAALPTVDGVQATSCKAKRASGGWVFLFVPAPGQTTLDLARQVPDCSQSSVQ